MMDENIIEFFRIVGKLKKVERTGWVTQIGIPNPESVAEHSFRAVIIGMFISDMRENQTFSACRNPRKAKAFRDAKKFSTFCAIRRIFVHKEIGYGKSYENVTAA